MSNFIAIDLDSQGLYAVAGTARGAAKLRFTQIPKKGRIAICS